jgi:acetyl esterase/lipase
MPDHRIVPYGDHPSQFVEVWESVGPARGSTVLIHGGYWRDRYGLDLMHPMAAHLAQASWRVFNIEYRRLDGDEAIWDAMAADVTTAVGLAEPGPVIAIGHSAGGQLALWAASAVSRRPDSRPDAVVALAPVADLVQADQRNLSRGAVRQLLGGGFATIPHRYRSASPAHLVPLGRPQLIIHGDADEDVPIDLTVDYARAAGAAGDPIELLTPEDVDHFHLIDPDHDVWRVIDSQLARWAEGHDPHPRTSG